MTTISLPATAEASQGQAAGLISRTVADFVDVLVTIVLVLVAHLGVSAFRFVLHPRTFRWPQPGAGMLSWLAAILFVLYLTAGWSITGRTLGKQMMGLRAVRKDGAHLGLGRSFVRALLCAAFPIGLVWCAVDRQHRAVHDLLLGTAVLYDWRRRVPSSA